MSIATHFFEFTSSIFERDKDFHLRQVYYKMGKGGTMFDNFYLFREELNAVKFQIPPPESFINSRLPSYFVFVSVEAVAESFQVRPVHLTKVFTE